MIKALWFMVKLSLLVVASVWVAEHPGTVEIEWLAYTVRIHVGLFLFALLVLLLLSIFIYNAIKTFADFPKSYRRYREVTRFEKGYKALTLGLAAVAAGDAKIAAYQAHRTETLLDKDAGLPLLLKAQAARMQGRDEDAKAAFAALLEDKDAAFLGVRGLLQTALDQEDYEDALKAARKALALQPKQPWILKTVYDIEIRLRRWDEARKILRKAEKYGALSKGQALSDRVAMLHAQAEELLRQNKREAAQKTLEKARRLDRAFVPTIVQLAQIHHMKGKRRTAVRLIERAWRAAPHPDLAKLWEELISKDRAQKPLGRMQWAARLLKLKPDSALAQMTAGRVATEEGLWGEARGHFEHAEQIEAGALLYQLWAGLEEKATHDQRLVQKWLDKAGQAAPSKMWVCRQTGRIYEAWQPIAEPHGAFNSIIWAVPQGFGAEVAAKPVIAEAVLEAPKMTG